MANWDEIYEKRKRREQEMLEERARVRELFRKRGIPEYKPGERFDRIVKVEQLVDYGCRYEDTCFVIPEDIDLEKVVRWFIHDTKYGSCTVFLDGCPPTTIWYDEGVDYFFRHYGKKKEA